MTEEKHRLTDFKEFSIKQLLELGNLSGLTKTFKDSTKDAYRVLKRLDEKLEENFDLPIYLAFNIQDFYDYNSALGKIYYAAANLAEKLGEEKTRFYFHTKAMGLEHADEGYERMLEVRIPIVSAITKYTESGKTKIVLTDQLAGGEWFE